MPIAFTITSSNVVSASSAIVPPGRAAVVTSYKPLIGSAVEATLRTSLLSPAPVTVTTAIYSTPPTVRGTIFDAGGLYMDLLAPAAGILDSITARFYYPLSITGTAEDALKLQYWNTATQKLELVTMSNGFGLITYPLQNKTDRPPYFGGSFEVTFDRNSKPAITDLKGTIFTTAPEPLDDANVKQGPQRTQP